MLNQLKKQPFFLILIPMFFVLHGVKENFGFIGFKDAALLTASYLIAAVLLFLLSFIFFRNKVRSALFASFLLSIYLFFGAIQDFFKDHLRPFAKYSVLLSAFLILMISLFIYLKKRKKGFPRLVFYMNLVLSIYVAMDLISVSLKAIHPPANRFTVFPFVKDSTYQISANTAKPDIYFLLFDEYASSLSLKEHYDYDNGLDSFLVKRGFQIQKKSYSNYNFTFLSMASMLNMSYLNGISNKSPMTIDDIGYCTDLIRNNKIIKFLSVEGYNIINYSIFDLAGNPSPIRQTLLPLKTRLITDNTLLSRMYRDMGWIFYIGPFEIERLASNRVYRIVRNNEMIMDSVINRSASPSPRPAFIYAHVYIPHDPFFFDQHGHLRDKKTVIRESINTFRRNSKTYLDYLTYGNGKIKKLIDAIQSNTKGNAVIILMGDHGFREYKDQNLHQNFQNLNAVYFPNRDYHLMYDSISCVNQFRVIFNTLFNQSFALQKDSTIFFQ